jgi:hypothetical protein
MRQLVSLALFFGILIILRVIHKQMSGFRGGFGAGVGGSGAAYQEIGFQDLNEAPLIYEKRKEAFRGGGGESIGGRTAGPSNLGDLGESEELFTNSDQKEKNKQQIQEAFQNLSPSSVVTGVPETGYVDGPADASLKQPRKPYNLLQDLPAAPRGSISCLKASCCAETDFEWRTMLTGNYLQRTNNYKREFPDNCSTPLTEFNLAFYKNSFLPKA